MKRSLILLVLIPSMALAATATLTWVAPTNNTDGTALPASQITGYNVYYAIQSSGACPSSYTTKVTVTGNVLTTTVPNLTVGTWCFVATTLANGLESVYTNPVTKVVPQPAPGPPSSLAVTALTAYTFEKQVDKIAFLAVGTVPAGTACDVTQPVGAYYVVPRAAVTWFGSVRPPLVVASCG